MPAPACHRRWIGHSFCYYEKYLTYVIMNGNAPCSKHYGNVSEDFSTKWVK